MSDNTIYVIGCGVIGLTTALRLQSSRALNSPQVHILASHLPSDPLSASYASTAAGAHHLSFAADDDKRQRWLDTRTLQVMMEELDEAERTLGEGEGQGRTKVGLMKVHQTEYFDGDEKHIKLFEGMPDFKIRPRTAIPARLPATHSVSFTSLTMTPEIYLENLYKRFLAQGGNVHRVNLTHVNQAATFLPGITPRAIILCVGIGALTLGGVSDQDVFPTRGQVLVMDAPWCNIGFTFQQGALGGGEGGIRTYVIPRSNGEVIIGGTREIDDWNANPRAETQEDVLQRALRLAPELLPLNTPPSELNTQALKKYIKAHAVGWRPSRKGGVRIESAQGIKLSGAKEIQVVANYGHGGFGWQSCWGSAEIVVELLGGEKAPEVSDRFKKCLEEGPIMQAVARL